MHWCAWLEIDVHSAGRSCGDDGTLTVDCETVSTHRSPCLACSVKTRRWSTTLSHGDQAEASTTPTWHGKPEAVSVFSRRHSWVGSNKMIPHDFIILCVFRYPIFKCRIVGEISLALSPSTLMLYSCQAECLTQSL